MASCPWRFSKNRSMTIFEGRRAGSKKEEGRKRKSDLRCQRAEDAEKAEVGMKP
jgi:hypothetical protein